MTRLATDRLIVAVVATTAGALAAVLGGVPEAAVLMAPWAVLLTLGLTLGRRTPPTTVTSVERERVLVDDTIAVDITITDAAGTVTVTPTPAGSFWRPTERASLSSASQTVGILVDDYAHLRAELTAPQWGTHRIGQVDVTVTEPYGLFRWRGSAGAAQAVRVHPRPQDIRDLLAPWLVRRISGIHRSASLGRGVEYADIRPYSPGDTLRQINWRVSARSPELWVSQRHPDRATDVVLLLDSFVESGHDARTSVGLAIEAAIALADSHLAATDRVGLVDFGGVVRWVNPGTGELQLQRLVDALLSTSLYASFATRNIAIIPPRALPPRSFVVALTPLLDQRFIDALALLRARGHDIAVVECIAEDGPPVAVTDDPTAALAYRFWQAERQVVRDRLAERGVAVAGWRRGDHLALTLGELTRRRHRTARVGRI